jgi:hypothetical protein
VVKLPFREAGHSHASNSVLFLKEINSAEGEQNVNITETAAINEVYYPRAALDKH